ncbi:DNA recombination protein RmuC [Chelativorans sp. ZYF759]|uniref:DNA recombination protein RmuC n=1 Tax=Chelativorans sp. ZYF759 TaxID=2692213 RepID=UPI00145DCC49|nr:DNA recombination protein RmuC [Chelativorans sp. ZYF759]NMG41762.1 DNA recombination protein RmuC [Chelativorans sp. ZYF759]
MNDPSAFLTVPILQIGGTGFSLGEVLAVALASMLVLCVLLVWLAARAATSRRQAAEESVRLAREAEARMAEITRAQAEMQGRMGTMAEIFSTRQAELNKAIGERLDGMTSRLGHSITEQTRSTHENLAKLQERLAVIDTAQNNIQPLAGQVVQLQHILSNKQTRGAFGQSRMEAIVADGLPMGGYTFQATLSNGTRPDCVVKMPNDTPDLVIDAKFPLEAWNAIRAAGEAEGGDAATRAAASFRRDVEVHIKVIAEKYLIPGETQDVAFMFVPSESIFAEIHENFEGLIHRAHRARIVIVSPSLLMLSIQVIQSVLKDARMREQAHLIQHEVIRLMEDVNRLDDRVRKLQGHFLQTGKDIDQILTSTEKITRRGQKIEALELGSAEAALPEDADQTRAAASTTGKLRLRVIDDE